MQRTALVFIVMFLLAVSSPAQEKKEEPSPSPVFPVSKQITVALTSISLEKYGAQKEGVTFKAGETVFINLEMKGLKADKGGDVVIQADLVIPQLGLDKKNLVNGSTPFEETVPMYFQIPIGSVERGGTCEATITIRDMTARTQVEFKTTFQLAE